MYIVIKKNKNKITLASEGKTSKSYFLKENTYKMGKCFGRGGPHIRQYLNQGYSGTQKVLIDLSDISLLAHGRSHSYFDVYLVYKSLYMTVIDQLNSYLL